MNTDPLMDKRCKFKWFEDSTYSGDQIKRRWCYAHDQDPEDCARALAKKLAGVEKAKAGYAAAMYDYRRKLVVSQEALAKVATGKAWKDLARVREALRVTKAERDEAVEHFHDLEQYCEAVDEPAAMRFLRRENDALRKRLASRNPHMGHLQR